MASDALSQVARQWRRRRARQLMLSEAEPREPAPRRVPAGPCHERECVREHDHHGPCLRFLHSATGWYGTDAKRHPEGCAGCDADSLERAPRRVEFHLDALGKYEDDARRLMRADDPELRSDLLWIAGRIRGHAGRAVCAALEILLAPAGGGL